MTLPPPVDTTTAATATPATFLPWQQRIARDWLAQQDRFAHAWLIHGTAGIGKTQFALAAAASLLCEDPQHGLACGHCQACRWVALGNHPDVRRIRPDAVAALEGDAPDEGDATLEKKTLSRDIRIDQLRTLNDWFNTATHRGGWRVAVLYPAQALNHISANALLKVLEEPPAHTVFLLVADAPDRLLPTLVSRCRRLPLPMPDAQTSLQWLTDQGVARAEQWLAAAGRAPLRALHEASTADAPYPAWLRTLLEQSAKGAVSVAQLADQLEPVPVVQWIDTLQRLLVDLALAQRGLAVRYYPGMAAAVTALAQGMDARALMAMAKWLNAQRAVANHPLNAKLYAHAMAQQLARVLQARPSFAL